MSISPLTAYGFQSTQSSALQALLAQFQTKTSGQASVTSAAGDHLSVSPMAQYLAKAPQEIAAPLQDLMTTRKDVTADLKAIQAYYTAHPEERARLGAAMQLQGSGNTQGAGMLPAMQAGIVDLYALSNQIDEASGTKPSAAAQGKAILAFLQHQGSPLKTLSGTDLTGTSTPDQYSLFTYLT